MRRFVQIGLAILSLAACVIFAALWTRSYRWAHLVHGQVGAKQFEIISIEGRLKITALPQSAQSPLGVRSQNYHIDSTQASTIWRHIQRFANSKGFGFSRAQNVALLLPYWFLTVAFALLAALLGTKRLRRFSVRSLLIAISLFAVLLWMMVGSE
ncbi:MAG: hypothetical protein WD738_03050 [Pirellulales bacterium]